MDADEFSRTVRPAKLRSRLAPFWLGILKLRNQGYSLAQIREFLSLNNVTISIAGLAAYIKRQEVAADHDLADGEKGYPGKKPQPHQVAQRIDSASSVARQSDPVPIDNRQSSDGIQAVANVRKSKTFEKYENAGSLANRFNKPKGS